MARDVIKENNLEDQEIFINTKTKDKKVESQFLTKISSFIGFIINKFTSSEPFNNKLDKVSTEPQTVAGAVEFLSDITVPSASVILGKDGAKISSAGRGLQYVDARSRPTLFPEYHFDNTGSEKPHYWVIDPLMELFPVCPDIDGTILTGNIDLPFVGALGASMTKALYVVADEVGIMRLQLWAGHSDTGAVLIDQKFEITTADVLLKFVFPVPIISEAGDLQLARFSGVNLKGAVQTSGAFIGVLCPQMFFDVHLLTDENFDRYYAVEKASLSRVSQTTVALVNQQDGVYETYHEYQYTPSVTDTFLISSCGVWSINDKKEKIFIKFSIVGDIVNKEGVLAKNAVKDDGIGEVVNVLVNGLIVGNADTGTDSRNNFNFSEVVDLVGGEVYTIKLEFSAGKENKEAAIYSNLFQVEQKTVKP